LLLLLSASLFLFDDKIYEFENKFGLLYSENILLLIISWPIDNISEAKNGYLFNFTLK